MSTVRFRALLPGLAWAVCSIAPASHAGATVPAGWEYLQKLDVAAPGLVEVRLPPATLDLARRDRDDLRIFDGAGTEVPYFVHPKSIPRQRTAATATEVSQADAEDSTVGVYRTTADGPVDTITLQTPARDFVKPVTLEASDDRRRWRPLAVRYPVFRQPGGAERLEIRVAPGRYPFLRITVGDTRERPIPLTAVVTGQTPPESTALDTVRVGPASVSNEGGATRIMLNLPARHLTVHRVTIAPDDPVFSREVTVALRTTANGEVREQVLARGRIHRVSLDGVDRAEVLSIPIPPTALSGRTLVVTVENGDSPPLAVREPVAVTFEPTRLRFTALPGEQYTLAVGNRSAKAPRYDLAALPSLGSAPLAGSAAPGALQRNQGYRAEEPAKGAAAAGGVIEASRWRRSRRVLTAEGGVQALEVPPEALARSPGLGDLRLVADGRQVPYVVERGYATRRISVPLEKLPPERGDRVSRLQVRLPPPGLPLQELRFTVEEKVFRRGVRVYEELPPERGGMVSLATAVWERRGEDSDSAFLVEFGGRWIGDSLILEVNDGDNAPLTLSASGASWRASRLLFKTPAGKEVSLLYDNPDAGPPSYDLALLADELLAADAAAATLEPDETRERADGMTLPDGWKQWAFWGALAFVTAVLVGVIAKLLPSAPRDD